MQELLGKVETRILSQSENHFPELGEALVHLLSSGGKRVRPAVTLLTGNMLGADPERLVSLAAAVELLHTATLVHDDLIDGAFLRRGIATLNSRWSPAATVLTGDFFFAKAAKLASDTVSLEVMKLFAQTLVTIVNGEITQMFSGRGKIRRDQYDQRIYAKTASLFESAASSAAILSAAPAKMVSGMSSFGYSIGMAFQIVDDILDFTGEQATVGKPVASDLRNGIFTLPVLYYLESHPGDADLELISSGNHVDEAVIEKVVTAIRASGAIQLTMEDARQYVEQGLRFLDGMPDNPERQSLAELARYIVNRQM